MALSNDQQPNLPSRKRLNCQKYVPALTAVGTAAACFSPVGAAVLVGGLALAIVVDQRFGTGDDNGNTDDQGPTATA